MDWKRLTASALMLGLLALPASAASITPQTTMKEIRDDPDIRASGLYTYTYVWERDCEKLSTSRDDETLAEVVDDTSAEACAAGLNYLAQVYHDGVQVTYPLYSEEEIAAMPSRAHVELYYCPAEQPGAKFAIVLSGNSLYYSGELRGGVSTAWELHQQGYAVFALRYRIGLDATDNAPLEDLGRAIQFITANAQQFGVQTEDYALVGYSSGGQIAGIFGGKKLGFQIPTASIARIPYLADGGYVARNTPRLAVIGDNKRYGEIVAPEDKLQKMVDLAVSKASGGSVTKAELESIVNSAVLRIVAALSALGFSIDGETLARAQQKVQQEMDRRYNTVQIN